MTKSEQLTIRAGRNEVESYKDDGYRFIQRYPEPNNSYSIVLQHPHTLRRLTIVVQPRWGMVLTKEGSRILKVKTFD